jgi:hypothetical protein
VLSLIGGMLSLLASLQYARDILRHRASPNLVTWTLWAAFPVIAVLGQVAGKGTATLAFTSCVALGPSIVVVVALRCKTYLANWNLLDLVCCGLACSGVVLWIAADDPVQAVFWATMADALAATPTLVKAWQLPETESVPPYLLAALGAGFALLSTSQWSVTESLFPSYVAIVTSLIAGVALLRGRQVRLGASSD